MAASVKSIIEEARETLLRDRSEFDRASQYYQGIARTRPLGPAIPPEMRSLGASVGYSRVYLDSVEERITVLGFRMPGESLTDDRLGEWWQYNDLDEESGLAHLEALIHGRCYITVAAPDVEGGDIAGTPIIRVESARYMYAKVDKRTRKVEWAVRFYSDPYTVEPGQNADEFVTLYLPESTTTYKRTNNGSYRQQGESIVHDLGQVPVVPMRNRELISMRDGCSEITPEIRSITDMASRILANLQAAAELMAVPQRIIFGMTKEELGVDPSEASGSSRFKSYMANILAASSAEGRAFQFSAADLRNYVDALQELSKQIASYTGLPPQYLSFSSDNPASAEAIQATESRLVKKCLKKGKMFGNGWERVMRLGILIIDGSIPEEAYRMEAVLENPGTPTPAAQADAVTKLYANGMGVLPKQVARRMLGFTDLEIQLMEEMDEKDPATKLNELLGRGSMTLPTAPRPGASGVDNGPR